MRDVYASISLHFPAATPTDYIEQGKSSMERRGFLVSAAATAFIASPVWGQEVHLRRFYLESMFGQLHGHEAAPTVRISKKTPLLCFHHTPRSASLFTSFLTLMGTDRISLAFDTPGYGASDGPDGRTDVETYAEAMAMGLDRMGYGANGRGPVDVLGFLTGATIACELALSRPDLVRRIVFVHALVMSKEGRLALKEEIETRVRQDWERLGNEFYVKRLADALAANAPDQMVEEVVAEFVDSTIPGRDYLKGGMTALSYPAMERFALIKQPTLFLVLDEERADVASNGVEVVPGAKLIRLQGLNRHSFHNKPEALVYHVRTFLDSEV